MNTIEFDDLTPRELSIALEDQATSIKVNEVELLGLLRNIGVIIRNKGVKQHQQIRDPKRFYRFSFEKPKQVEKPTPEMWEKMDKRYIRPAD